MTYDEHDIKPLDPIAHVRGRPEMYLSGGRLDPACVANQIAGDALLLGARSAMTFRHTDFWAVAADHDWLSDGRYTVQDLFRNVVPFPAAGVNSYRSEVLLGAFADVIRTWSSASDVLVRGPSSVAADCDMCAQLDGWARVIAFRLIPDPSFAKDIDEVWRKERRPRNWLSDSFAFAHRPYKLMGQPDAYGAWMPMQQLPPAGVEPRHGKRMAMVD